MANPFNLLTVMNVFSRHTTHCPKCRKSNLIAKANQPQEVTCKHCGCKYTVNEKR